VTDGVRSGTASGLIEPSTCHLTTNLSVLAIVLTHNAPRALTRCLDAIVGQTRPPDALVVVDNASSPAAAVPDASAVRERLVIRMEENLGPAGGHARGLAELLARTESYAWVMDDDCVPAPECLERLLAAAAAADTPGLVFPNWIDGATGEVANYPAWCGFLIPREIVAAVGLPREDFFWWAEDTEYLRWRIPEAGYAVMREPRAEVLHARVRITDSKPAWKVYYEVRNSVYYRLFVQRRKPKRFLRLARTLLRTLGRVLREDDRRRKLRLYGRGIVDGLTKRLGRTVPARIEER
jgi:rhamnopyranosyl-N-acetylglucosaminyl-diphospho-decaprenol beta-1,3/1,4-galactofuranosyltransferase